MTRKEFFMLSFIPFFKKLIPKQENNEFYHNDVDEFFVSNIGDLYLQPRAIDNIDNLTVKIYFSVDGEHWLECDDMELLFGTGKHEPEGFVMIEELK